MPLYYLIFTPASCPSPLFNLYAVSAHALGLCTEVGITTIWHPPCSFFIVVLIPGGSNIITISSNISPPPPPRKHPHRHRRHQRQASAASNQKHQSVSNNCGTELDVRLGGLGIHKVGTTEGSPEIKYPDC